MPLIRTFEDLGRKYVFDANSNTILPLAEDQWPLVREIERGVVSGEAQELLESFNQQGYFLEAAIHKIEHPETSAMKYHLTRKIKKLTLQVTQNCNLRCDYCVYSGVYETRAHSAKSMSLEVAKKAIDYVLANSVDEKSLNFGFYGGEPLLELDLIETCISYVRSVSGSKELTFTLTTNGTLLTCEAYERLVGLGVDVAISLDGPRDVHDSARKYPDGRGSFDDIIRNLSKIQAKHPDAKDKLRFMAVVNPEVSDSCLENLYTMDDIFPEYGINMAFVNDLYIDKPMVYSGELLSKQNQERTKLLLFMLGKLGSDKVSRLVIGGRGAIELKYEQLRRIKKLPPICHPGGPCLAGAHRLFVNVDGVFYPCERVSEASEVMKIGDVDSGVSVEKANVINNIGKTTAEECKKCWAILHCAMCGAFSDDFAEFSRGKRLSQCANSKLVVEEAFKDVCFLKSRGYNFEDKAL